MFFLFEIWDLVVEKSDFKNLKCCLDSYCFISFYVCALTERHPIKYAIDGTNSWWQSPSIQNGMEYHYVTITLDLKQVETQTHTWEENLSVPCLYCTPAWSYSSSILILACLVTYLAPPRSFVLFSTQFYLLHPAPPTHSPAAHSL